MISYNIYINKLLFKKKNKNNIKSYFTFFIIIYIFIIFLCRSKKNFELNENYLNMQIYNHLDFPKKLKNKIRICIYIDRLKGGGAERITSLFLNYFYKIEIFDLFLFTFNIREIDEYKISDNIKRFFLKNDNINIVFIEKFAGNIFKNLWKKFISLIRFFYVIFEINF